MTTFADYKELAAQWITVVATDFYPDYLDEARVIYGAVVERFTELAQESDDSADLLRKIAQEKQPIRRQLQRVFRKYVSPDTSVEMLKRKSTTEDVIRDFGGRFRPIIEVRTKLSARPAPDDVLLALLLEYKDRGQNGYELTNAFFTWFEANFSEEYDIKGPRGAGGDVMLNKELPDYAVATPADFVITRENGEAVAVGFARYDSDRGGAQEDDRTSGNRDKITAILEYNKRTCSNIKILFINDGPGLLLGSMWDDYAELEDYGEGIAMVCTLKMLEERLTASWLAGGLDP